MPEVKDCSIFKENALNTVNQLEVLREAINNSRDRSICSYFYVKIKHSQVYLNNYILEYS
ncbi:MAG: hypothetical protein R3Y64_08890 [Peptostreptococcaceae bacterium]